MRHTDPRAAYAARTAQIHAKLERVQQLANGHFGQPAPVLPIQARKKPGETPGFRVGGGEEEDQKSILND